VPVPLGINIVNTNHGADSATSTDDEIVEDYVRSIRLLNAHAGYLMLNLSCPNTGDGRAFVCDPHRVRQLLNAVREASPSKPVFLKVAPFSDSRSLDSFLEQVDAVPFVRGFGINLPPGKAVPLRTAADGLRLMPGAVSGLPCRTVMHRALADLYSRMDRKRYCLIGTGGVSDGASAYKEIRLGASLVQMLTALVYEGPGIVQRVLRELDARLARDGFTHVADAIGIDNARENS
jgi:dihydroorotate dehydrogenase (fumarate)/dihydroorotate dehydrogenase